MAAKLVIKNGSRKGREFPLSEGIFTIGRNRTNNICLEDDRVSQLHCEIYCGADGMCLIRDLGSTNGTIINGRLVKEKDLARADEIKLGNTILTFTTDTTLEDLTQRAESPTAVLPEEKSTSFLFKHSESSETPIAVLPTAEVEEEGFNRFEINLNRHPCEIIEPTVMEEDLPRRQKALKDLTTLYRMGNIINALQDSSRLFDTIMDIVFQVIKADRGFLAILDEETGELIPKAVRKRENMTDTSSLTISQGIIKRVMDKGTSLLISDALADERLRKRDSIVAQNIRSCLCVPLKSRNKILGFIHVDSLATSDAFSKDDLRLLSAIGAQAGIAIENTQLFEKLQELMFGSIRALVATIEAKAPYWRYHSQRVADISSLIAQELGLSAEEQKTIELAALLHDVGKIGTPETILHKDGALTPQQKAVVHSHSSHGANIVSNIKGIDDIVRAVRHHHERFDGRGYPDGLKGEAIPLYSRIIALADAYDAMTSIRPYRENKPLAEVISEIEKGTGKQFDPSIVAVFLSALSKQDAKVTK
jgi:putative nucleotidyltransferase with HDIG domain